MERWLVMLAVLAAVGFLAGLFLEDAETDPTQVNRIAAVYLAGDAEKAAGEFEAYLSSHPKDALAWTILGNAYRDLDRLADAEKAYDHALAVAPSQPEALTGKGVVYRTRKDYPAAEAMYLKALEHDPAYAQAYSSLVVIAFKRGQDAKALEYAKRGYELDPSDATIAANYAVALHYAGSFEERDRLTQRAEELGYKKLDRLQSIYAGDLDVHD